MVIDVKLEHPANVDQLIFVTVDGIVIEDKPEQLLKVPPPMLVTEDGMVIDIKFEQPEKALVPIAVIVEGMVQLVIAVVPIKKFEGIWVTLSPKFTIDKDEHPLNIGKDELPTEVQLFALQFIVVRFVQF